MPRVTASRLERTERCAWSAAGAGVETTGAYAERGTGAHAFGVDAFHKGRDAALQTVPQNANHRKFCERLDLAALPWWHGNLPPDAVVYLEAAFALNGETGAVRMLRSREEYRHLGAWDFAGQADAVAFIPSTRTVRVWDLKTGSPTEVILARENRQLAGYAMLAGLFFGAERVEIAITHCFEDGSPWTSAPHVLDGIDLAAVRAGVRATIARVREAETAADPRPFLARGSWCRYCPRFTDCPAQLAVFRALVGAVLGKQPAAIAIEQVRDARSFLRDAKHWIDELETTIKEYARVEAIPTDKPGVVYREVIGSQKEIVNHRVALRVLAERCGPDVAQAATILETSIGLIEDAVRQHAKLTGQKIGRAKDETFQAMRDAGALIDAETRRVREAKAAAPGAGAGGETDDNNGAVDAA